MNKNSTIVIFTDPKLGEKREEWAKRVLPTLGMICRTMAGFAPISQQVEGEKYQAIQAKKTARTQRVQQRLLIEEQKRQARKAAHKAEVNGGHTKGVNAQPNKHGKK